MPTLRRRRSAVLVVAAMVASLATVAFGASPASADTAPPGQLNGCWSAVGQATDGSTAWSTFPIPITGTAPASILQDGSVPITGMSVVFGVTGTLVAAGASTGILNVGVEPDPPAANFVAGGASLRVDASNTVEGTQTTTGTTSTVFYIQQDLAGDFHIFVDDGTGNPGAEVSVLPVPVPLDDLTFTNDGGGPTVTATEARTPLPTAAPGTSLPPSDQANAPIAISATISGTPGGPGPAVGFFCWPGTSNGAVDPGTGLPGGGSTLTPATDGQMNPITVTNVQIPPTAPSCVDQALSVGATQSIGVDPGTVCSDPNGNFTPSGATVAIVSSPTDGSVAVNATTGVITYTNATIPLSGQDSFTFEVTDDGGLTSSPPTLVTISILADQCTWDEATGDCSLTQKIQLTVTGAAMTLDQAGSTVQLDGVTLDGDYQITSGALQQLTITNARGTAAGWSVTGVVTDFVNEVYGGGGATPALQCRTAAGYDRNCIPGTNLAWGPDAAVAHTVIPGDVATVGAGAAGDSAAPWTTPMDSAELCSAPMDQSGGTFTCDADLWLGVPASAGAGDYLALLTLTLA